MSEGSKSKPKTRKTAQVLKKKAMIEALQKHLGVVSQACKKAGVGRRTHYEWIQDDSEYAQACEDIAEDAIDFAESKLYKQIDDENTTATIFYLKTKGKNRGYVERQETAMVTPEGMPVIEINGRTVEPESSTEGDSK